MVGVNDRKLLSVVVPTKNRYKYLKYLIELVADFHSDEIELVIQDNSDNNLEFVEYLKGLDYDFIKYNHIEGQIPMSVNSDKAILNSTGEYVCFIGDDDGLTKYTIDCARWMKNNKIDAVKSSTLSYFWPDYLKGNKFKPSGSITYGNIRGKIRTVNPEKELLKVLRKGILDLGDMPRVYQNIVSRKVLDELFNNYGTCFPGNSPDISNAIAISLTAKNCKKINFPLAFSGGSAYHGGGVYANGRKKEPEITEVPWFRPNVEENWDKRVPKVASPALIWVDSALNTIKHMGREELFSIVNFKMIYGAFAVRNPEYVDIIKPFFNNNISYISSYLYAFIYTRSLGLFRRFKKMLGITKIIRNVNDIKEAANYLEKMAEPQKKIFQ